ncbi:MAG TPA: response regulator [Pelovirga sp.]|nr:response regulator [Pelovirga sp.]
MKKVLIVDDEASFLLSLKDVLKAHRDKFEILTAENGSVAVDLLRETSFDLLVTDLRMPEMNGFELLAWVSRHQPQLPVIAMSAFGTPEIEARLKKMDTLQFIEKPVDLPLLEKAIFNGLKAGGKSFIRGITLATFLQLMNVEKKNCTLKIAAPQGPAYLFVASGELIDAEYANTKGLEAALEIVSWDDAEIEMDGICRRQDDVIKLPLGHLLIEAFRIKDETAEEDKKKASEGSPILPTEPVASAPVDSALVRTLSGITSVQEFAIFDTQQGLAATNTGVCTIATFDINAFTEALTAIAQDLDWSEYRSMALGTTKRNRYLLFNQPQQQLVLKLKPGAQAAQVLKEIERIVAL